MFDGIMFDLDGTLWNSVPEIVASWNMALEQQGVDRTPLTVEEVTPCMGMLLPDIAKLLLPGAAPERQQEVIQVCCQVENQYLAQHGAQTYPGVVETLTRLQGVYPLFVVSNCQDGYIEAFFQGNGLRHLFTDYECAGRTGLPKSENIALVARRHGLKKPLYVGDTDLDRQSAQKAGVAFLHAAYGFGQVENVPAIRRFEDLIEAVEHWGE
jgi:phosphoglycolate phosphatase